MIRVCLAVLLTTGMLFASGNVTKGQTAGPPKYKVQYGADFPNARTGEVPVRVLITRQPAVPRGRDQLFNVVISDQWYQRGRQSKLVSSPLVIPAGKTSAEIVLNAKLDDPNSIGLLIENGRGNGAYSPDDLLQAQIMVQFRGRALGLTNESWLLISDKVKGNRQLQTTVASNGQTMGMNVPTTAQQSFAAGSDFFTQIKGLKKVFGETPTVLVNRPNWHAVPPADLPESWVGLSCINFILISFDEFESLCVNRSYQELFENWVASGGSLVVFNKEKSLDHADKIFPAMLGSSPNSSNRAEWLCRTGSTKRPTRTIPVTSERDPSLNTLKTSDQFKPDDLVAVRRYLRGQVIATVSPESVGSKLSFDSFQSKQPVGKQTVNAPNSNLSAVPGVGKPPIFLFAIATGLFLFLIGPVMLVVVSLNNDRRFLFFIVPVTSFLTCSCILGYAFVADFNKQWARTETVMILDQSTGRAFGEATAAYYCGNQPSYYSFDKQTMFSTGVDENNGYSILQLENESRLSSSRIQPRRTHEVFTAKPFPTQQKFLVVPSEENPRSIQVTNLLGGRITVAGFEHKGQYYLIRNLEHQETHDAELCTRSQCRTDIGKVIRGQRLPGGTSFFNNRTSQNQALALNSPRQFTAVLETNPATEPLIQPFEIKLQTNIIHGRY